MSDQLPLALAQLKRMSCRPRGRDLALEEPGRMAAVERAERLAVEARRLDAIRTGDEGAGAIAAVGGLDAEAREGVEMRPGDEIGDFLVVELPSLAAIAGAHAPSYAVGTPQMSRAYSRMVRSAENQATLAVLRMVLPYQAPESLQIPSIRRCAAA